MPRVLSSSLTKHSHLSQLETSTARTIGPGPNEWQVGRSHIPVLTPNTPITRHRGYELKARRLSRPWLCSRKLTLMMDIQQVELRLQVQKGLLRRVQSLPRIHLTLDKSQLILGTRIVFNTILRGSRKHLNRSIRKCDRSSLRRHLL